MARQDRARRAARRDAPGHGARSWRRVRRRWQSASSSSAPPATRAISPPARSSIVARGPCSPPATRGASRALAEELGGLEWAVADVARPDTVRALVERGDVLVSTVGPFARWGEPAVQAAIAAGAHYLDSTGEGSFIRAVFERFGPGAQAAGCGLLTAFGYDWVPGNLAGALALRDAGAAATRVEIGYFNPGAGAASMSGGTRASAAGVMLSRRLRLARRAPRRRAPGAPRARVRAVARQAARAISASALRALRPAARAPDAARRRRLPGLVRPARPSRCARCRPAMARPLTAARARATCLDGLVRALRQGLDRRPRRRGARDQPLADRWPRPTTPPARALADVRLEGVNGYDFTAGILAWGARDRGARAGCRAPARWGRSTASGSTRWRPGARRRGSLGCRRSAGSAARAARSLSCRRASGSTNVGSLERLAASRGRPAGLPETVHRVIVASQLVLVPAQHRARTQHEQRRAGSAGSTRQPYLAS